MIETAQNNLQETTGFNMPRETARFNMPSAIARFNMREARFNMIEQQIRTWEVLDPAVLQLLNDVPRERFVPEEYQGLAFADIEIPLGSELNVGQTMLSLDILLAQNAREAHRLTAATQLGLIPPKCGFAVQSY